MESTQSKIPVTIITGFLGAGKTTFLQYVLKANHGKRIVVVQNEFGSEIGIEKAVLIKEGEETSQEWMELPNGCICCQVKDTFVETIENLIKRKEKFDYVFVETDGLADPGPVASIFWMDEAVETDLYLDGIVSIVDAKNILGRLNEIKDSGVNEAQRQVALADRLVINKIDLVSPAEVEALETRVRTINSTAPILHSDHGVVSLDNLLNIQSFDPSRLTATENAEVHDHEHDHDCVSQKCSKMALDDHQHDQDIKTVTLNAGEVDVATLDSWIGVWLWEHKPGEIFRLKGVVAARGESEKYMLQGVHNLYEVQPCEGIFWGADEKRLTKIVLVGKGLADMEASFYRDVVDSAQS